MPKAAKLGNIGTGHGACCPTPVIAGSTSVNIDNQPAARMGDPLFPHAAPDSPPHPRFIVTGSTSVNIDGQPAARMGDRDISKLKQIYRISLAENGLNDGSTVLEEWYSLGVLIWAIRQVLV